MSHGGESSAKGANASKDRMARSVVHRSHVADVQQQRGPLDAIGRPVDVGVEMLEPFARCRAEFVPSAVQVRYRELQQRTVGMGYRGLEAFRRRTRQAGDGGRRAVGEHGPITATPGQRQMVQDGRRQTGKSDVKWSEFADDLRTKQESAIEQFGCNLDLADVGEGPSRNPASSGEPASRWSPDAAPGAAAEAGRHASKHRIVVETAAHDEEGFLGNLNGPIKDQQRCVARCGTHHRLGTGGDSCPGSDCPSEGLRRGRKLRRGLWMNRACNASRAGGQPVRPWPQEVHIASDVGRREIDKDVQRPFAESIHRVAAPLTKAGEAVRRCQKFRRPVDSSP